VPADIPKLTPQPLQTPSAEPAVNPLQFSHPDYSAQGPLAVQKLPKLEHTCIRCFPACQINKCLLRVDVWYPKGGLAIGQPPPYPLAIFSSGFLVSSELYQSYARRLTSWGYTVMLYDKMETAVDPVDDELSASFITVRASTRPPQCQMQCSHLTSLCIRIASCLLNIIIIGSSSMMSGLIKNQMNWNQQSSTRQASACPLRREICVCLQELIDWAASDPILKQVADSRRVYLLGHSRGAKVATLAAVRDTRVAAVCLVDPVDNTVYAPLGPGFPSAATALRNIPDTRFLPVAIVGTPAPQHTLCL
jgi:dienelactone hydrolase